MSSKATKKRFVTKKLLMELVLPSEIEKVAQVTASRGNNLLEVEDEMGEKYLASMPTRFRNTVWVKRGHFVLLEPIEEGDKVRAEISHILDTENTCRQGSATQCGSSVAILFCLNQSKKETKCAQKLAIF
ncbi:translation initiation factor 1A / IF-1 domain-containing protein [Ditylenchus destructor]|uniref:Probable RNA-binding protein EIF1AD n=1 Tax=Ditylenchus destructor TaxID=166010 RepID=A0AAD4NDI8_9BILA|nr:translation initiation factor 1A / IF-1 domain-containing protein [Ditylenchus destructor]